MTTNHAQSDEEIRAEGVALRLLGETSTAAERVAGLRSIGFRVEEIAQACGVGSETVRLWESGRPPSARHHRLLDRTRYVVSQLLASVGESDRVLAWMRSCNGELGGVSPIEAMVEDSRSVMRAAAGLVISEYNEANDAPAPVSVELVDVPGAAERVAGEQGVPSLTSEEEELRGLVARGLPIAVIADKLRLSVDEARDRVLGLNATMRGEVST